MVFRWTSFKIIFSSEEESESELGQEPDHNLNNSGIRNREPASNIPLYILPPSNDIYKSQISFDDHLLAISTYATRHNISDTEFEHLLYLINLHLPDNNFLERNINKIKEKCGFYDDNLKLFTFCSVCENVFSNGVIVVKHQVAILPEHKTTLLQEIFKISLGTS